MSMGISGPILVAKVLRSPLMLVEISAPIFLAKVLRSHTDVGGDIWTNISSQRVKVPH